MTKKEFVRLIETLLDNAGAKEAWECIDLFPEWHTAGEYEPGQKVVYEGVLYECLQSHTSQDTWTPTDAPSLWAKVLIPDPEVIPEWEQPSSTNPYKKGDKVKHNGKVWISDVDGNVWEPPTMWTEVVS